MDVGGGAKSRKRARGVSAAPPAPRRRGSSMARRCAYEPCGDHFDTGHPSRATWRGVHTDRFCSPACHASYATSGASPSAAAAGGRLPLWGPGDGDNSVGGEQREGDDDGSQSASATSYPDGRTSPTSTATATVPTDGGDSGDFDAVDVDDLGLLAVAADGTSTVGADAAGQRASSTRAKQPARPHRRVLDAMQGLVSVLKGVPLQ